MACTTATGKHQYYWDDAPESLECLYRILKSHVNHGLLTCDEAEQMAGWVMAQVDREIPVIALCREDAATAIGITPGQLDELTEAGEIPHVRLGCATVYPCDPLRDWIEAHTQGG